MWAASWVRSPGGRRAGPAEECRNSGAALVWSHFGSAHSRVEYIHSSCAAVVGHKDEECFFLDTPVGEATHELPTLSSKLVHMPKYFSVFSSRLSPCTCACTPQDK